MAEQPRPGRILRRHVALARARRFQTETLIISDPQRGERVVKRALHGEGRAHLHRMAANAQRMRADRPDVVACPCAVTDDGLVMPWVDGVSLQQRLLDAAVIGDRAAIVRLLAQYRALVTAFDGCAGELQGPDGAAAIFAGTPPDDTGLVRSGNVDQGFDHWIARDGQMVLIDYEWVLATPVPLGYVLYRAAQLFFQDVPPRLSPHFRLHDLCALLAIDAPRRRIYDHMEARFQQFVRTEPDGAGRA